MDKKSETKYSLYQSIEEMITPASMSKILNRDVTQVTRQPFDSAGYSGSQFYWVCADEQRFVVKHLQPTTDWVALAYEDTKCRSVRLWEYGVLDHLQPHINHEIVAACQDGDSFALLMNDVSKGVIPFDHVHTVTEIKLLLNALAKMHAMFWNDGYLHDPTLGLNELPTLITGLWTSNHNRTRWDSTWIDNAWNLLLDFVDIDVRDTLQSLMDDPQPLFTKLKAQPSTLIHGDFRPENYAIVPDTKQIVLFDWQLAGYGSPLVDLHWCLSQTVMAEPFNGHEYYHQQLTLHRDEKIDSDQWQSMVEVGFLAGVLRLGYAYAGFAAGEDFPEMRKEINRKALVSVNDTVRKGLKWL